MSLGERKRVDFINCVGKSRDIYLLDEPFAHLDEINKDKMFNVLMELSKEKLVIVASHEYIDRCSSIISIRDKSVVVSNLDGKSYDVVKFKEPWYRYFIDNIKMVMLKVGVFLLLLCVSSYMSSYFKKVPEYKDIDMNVYGYKCGEEYCTPRYSDIMEYVSEGYRVFIEFELMGISEVYYEGRNIEDYVYVAYDGDGVCINDVFSSKYGNKGIDIVVDGVVYEEDVMGVYVDNCILPTIYIPYDKYVSLCSDDRFIVIDNPMEGNDTLERLEVYPLIKGNSTKKVNKLVDVNEVIVSCSMYGIWLMIVILWFEYNMKFYSNFRLNMSAISTIKYLLLERIPMFLISLLFSDWYIWVACLGVEIIFMKKYLDYRLKVVEKL